MIPYVEDRTECDAEKYVIATILENPEYVGIAIQTLGSLWSCAWTGPRETIAEEILTIFKDGGLPDRRIIFERLSSRGKAAEAKEIAEILKYAETVALLEQNCKILYHKVRCREATLTGEKLSRINNPFAAELEILEARNNLDKLSSGPLSMHKTEHVKKECLEKYQNQAERHSETTGVPTGFLYFDEETGGLPFGELTVLGARPSHGKSALAHNIAIYAAKEGYPVLIITHEMSRIMYTERLACTYANIHFQSVNKSNLPERMASTYFEALQEVGNLPITIIDEPSLSPYACSGAISTWSLGENKKGLVICDYLQLEHLPSWRGTRTEEVSKLSSIWHSTIARSGHAGLILSQLNRDSAGCRPKLSHLRESGAIEQDAYAVLLLYRQIVDNPETTGNQAEISLAKNRNGSLLVSQLHFTGYSMRFRDWAEDDKPIEGLGSWLKEERRIWEKQVALHE